MGLIAGRNDLPSPTGRGQGEGLRICIALRPSPGASRHPLPLGVKQAKNMRKIGKIDFNLKGHVRRVINERSGQNPGVVQDLQFDTDGFLLRENSGLETTDSNGIVTDSQKVLPDAGWALDNVGIALGTFVAVGTYGGWTARTTYDLQGLPVQTIFTNATGDETAAIRYVSDDKGRIVQAVQSLHAGFMSTFPITHQQEFLSLLGPDLICCRVAFDYDDYGRVTELNVDFMGKMSDRTLMTHNEHGDIATVTKQDDHTVRYEYDYDETGNWIRKVTYGPTLAMIETRRITYDE
jgi:hypothetical protein